jgi:hypothetical protein
LGAERCLRGVRCTPVLRRGKCLRRPPLACADTPPDLVHVDAALLAALLAARGGAAADTWHASLQLACPRSILSRSVRFCTLSPPYACPSYNQPNIRDLVSILLQSSHHGHSLACEDFSISILFPDVVVVTCTTPAVMYANLVQPTASIFS